MKVILIKSVQSPYVNFKKLLPEGRELEVEKELGQKWVDEGIAKVNTRFKSPFEEAEKRKEKLKKKDN